MGGQYETHVPGTTGGRGNGGKKTTVTQPGGIDVEIHQDGTQVHFHDRTGGKFKVSMRVSEFDRLRETLRRMEKYSYLDPQFNTLMEITPQQTTQQSGVPMVEYLIVMTPIECGPTVKGIEGFGKNA